MNRHLLKFLILIGAITSIFFILLVYVFMPPTPGPASKIEWGMTWSHAYAKSLGLNSEEGLDAALTDFSITHVRLPAYWTDVEPEQGKMNFSNLEKELAIVRKHNAQATIVLGLKQPRWPECYLPNWMKTLTLSEEDQQEIQLAYMRSVFDYFATNETVTSWQVENEPFFTFGECPTPNPSFIRKEVGEVRSWEMDSAKNTGRKPRPIVTTDSGEWSLWLPRWGKTDALGVTLYRHVLMPGGNQLSYWFISPGYYAQKARWLRGLVGPVYISELQMEPWGNAPIDTLNGNTDFTTDDMKDAFHFAQATGFERIDLWGVEWWYWMKTKQNHPEYWETAKEILNKK